MIYQGSYYLFSSIESISRVTREDYEKVFGTNPPIIATDEEYELITRERRIIDKVPEGYVDKKELEKKEARRQEGKEKILSLLKEYGLKIQDFIDVKPEVEVRHVYHEYPESREPYQWVPERKSGWPSNYDEDEIWGYPKAK